MKGRLFLGSAVVLPFFVALVAIAQPGDGHVGIGDSVLDMLCPVESSGEPYFTRMTLRFGDSATQLVVLTYPPSRANPSGRTELIRCSVGGMEGGNFSQLIRKIQAKNPGATDQEIADKVKVEVTYASLDRKTLDDSMNDLKALRISPVLQGRIALDEYSVYQFWYDTGQEYVHYLIAGPFHDGAQDGLVQWMIKFQAKTEVEKASPQSK